MNVHNDTSEHLLSEHEAGSKAAQTASKSKPTLPFLNYIAYILLTVMSGALETLGSSTYHLLETQLSTTSTHVAFILSVKAISSAVGALVTAFMLQYIRHSHRYIAACCTVIAATVALMATTHSLTVMFFIYVLIGYFIGVVIVSFPVLIFRLYPLTQSRALFTCMVMYAMARTTFPLIVSLSLHVSGSYAPALYPVSAIALLCASALCCLSTPQHDPFREMHQSAVPLTRREFNEIKDKMRADDSIKWYTKSLLAVLALMAFCLSSLQSALVNFALQYAIKGPAHSNANVGRYLISCYFGGQLLYRLIAATCCREIQPVRTLFVSNLIINVIGVVFLLVNFVQLDSPQIYVACLFAIYIAIGFFASPIAPSILKFIELVKTLDGLLSGMTIISVSVGDSITVAWVGLMIRDFGVTVLPLPIQLYMLLSFCSTVVAAVVFRKLTALKDDVTDSVVDTPNN